MSSEQDFFRRLAANGYHPRDGQTELWQTVATIIKPVYTFVWPTGYGKSDGGLGAYDIARQQQRVDRLLITVPTTTQREQYIASIEESARALGISLRNYRDPQSGRMQSARAIDGSAAELRLSHENCCEIFVVTIQLATRAQGLGFLLDLMSKGRWMVFHDEYHRLSVAESATFGQVARRLGGNIVLGATATPRRTDKRPTIFDNVEPDSRVTWKAAYEEQAIRGVAAHIEHYTVEVEDRDHNTFTLTTEDLAGTTSYTEYEYKRDLRYKDCYLSDILNRAVQILAAKGLQHPGQHQMLVFAMSLRHAEHVANLLNSYYENFADWVGTSRNDADNRAVFSRYQANELPCLVQVDKATEGFNNKRASVLVFLTLLHKRTVRTEQGSGRGVRRNHAIPFNRDIADMFCSPDSEISEHLKELALLTTGEISGPDTDDDDDSSDPDIRDPRGPIVVDLPPLSNSVVGAMHDHSDHYYPTGAEIDAARAKLHQHPQTAHGEISDEAIERVLRDIHHKDTTRAAAQKQAAEDLLTTSNVENAVRTLAGNAAALLLGERGTDVWKELWHKLCKQVNSRWRKAGGTAAKDSLSNDLRAKYAWLDQINQQMAETRTVPSWLANAR